MTSCRSSMPRAVRASSARAAFFFQAEDGIRDVAVTGVQTCALPISDLVAQPGMTLAGFVELLKARLADPPDESESGLAEEASREAVRIMSVHKAKGLEFPIVILVGLQAGTKPPYEPIQVQQDWSTGVLGLRLGDRCTLGGVYAAEKLGARLEAERRRVLYVGMTRAKERLVLSGGLTRRQKPGRFLALVTGWNSGGV